MKINFRLASGLGLSHRTINSVTDISTSIEKRVQVARALPQVNRPLWQGIETFLAKDPSSRVREQTAISLGATGDDEALQVLGKLASDGVPYVRLGVAHGLLKHGSKATFHIVAKLLNDDDCAVRTAAFRAFMRMQALYPEIAAKLEVPPLAMDPMQNMQEYVTDYLSYLRPSIRPSPLPKSTRKEPLLDIASLYDNYNVTSDLLNEELIALDLKTLEPEAPSHVDSPDDFGKKRGEDVHDKPSRRFVNSWFKGHPDPQEPLHYNEEYELGIQISPKLRIGSFTKGRPEFTEPQGGDQETLDVVVAIVTDDFNVLERKSAKRMRLPKDTRKDSPVVTFKVQPVKNNQDIFISVLFYHENNLFHEALIGARVQIVDVSEETRPTAYFPTENRFQTPAHGPRDLNIQVIEEKDGYRFILFYDFGKDQFDVVWCKIPVTRDRVGDLLSGVRQTIKDAVYTKKSMAPDSENVFFEGEKPDKPMREKRLPALHDIDEGYFQQAAQGMAKAGRLLFTNLFFPQKGSKVEREQTQRVGKKLLELSSDKHLRIQVLSDDFFIPWNFFYDGDFPTKEIEPYNFWGFKHVIEEIPHRVQELEVKDIFPIGDEPLGIGININKTKIHEALTTPQIEYGRALMAKLPVTFRYTEEDVLSALRGTRPQHPLEYFYCHAGTADYPQQDLDQSYIGLTSDTEGLTLESIKLQTSAHQFSNTPLFILNACESAQMDGRFYDGFVPKFLSMGACAVVGSDAEVPSLFGAHFGQFVLKGILKGDPLGEVLLSVRQQFLNRYRNPLGLIYRVFGNTDVRLSTPLV